MNLFLLARLVPLTLFLGRYRRFPSNINRDEERYIGFGVHSIGEGMKSKSFFFFFFFFFYKREGRPSLKYLPWCGAV